MRRVGNIGLLHETMIAILRWLTSIGFFFLALTKVTLIYKYGLEPYLAIMRMAGLPEAFSYYGDLAVAVEMYLAIGLWMEKHYTKAIALAIVLTLLGTILSVFFLVYKFSSDCGCGLLGDNEWGLLIQKVIIIIVLRILYKNKNLLFIDNRSI